MAQAFGFAVIVVLYIVIGLMAAVGAIFIVPKILGLKAEQIFYAMFLIMIAAFYVAFVSYFIAEAAWRLEVAVVIAFAAVALAGVRLPLILIIGYSLYGVCAWFTNFRRMESTRCSSPSSLLLCLSHTGSFAQPSTSA